MQEPTTRIHNFETPRYTYNAVNDRSAPFNIHNNGGQYYPNVDSMRVGAHYNHPLSGLNTFSSSQINQEYPHQSIQSFNNQITNLLFAQPLVIHTKIFPEGYHENDPRLQYARTVSEKTYIATNPIFPSKPFVADFHQALIDPSEPQRRYVR